LEEVLVLLVVVVVVKAPLSSAAWAVADATTEAFWPADPMVLVVLLVLVLVVTLELPAVAGGRAAGGA
jgi:hypothetical protein